MTSMRVLRNSRKAHMAAGALMLTVPGSAVALTVGQADAQSEVQIGVNSAHVGYGHRVTVTGSVPSGAPGQMVALEFARAGATRWQAVSSTRIGTDRRFRFVRPLHQTGLLRAVVSVAGQAPRAAVPSATSVAPSSPRHVSVASEFDLRPRSMEVLGGQTAEVRGRLLPGVRGRKVRLEGRSRRALARPGLGSHELSRRLPHPLQAVLRRRWRPWAAAAGAVPRRSPEHARPRACRQGHDLQSEHGLLVRRRRQYGLRLSRRSRGGQQGPAVRYQGRVPLRRAHRDRGGRRSWPVRRWPHVGPEPEHGRRAWFRRRRHRLVDLVGTTVGPAGRLTPSGR